jgi:hypothetical protein
MLQKTLAGRWCNKLRGDGSVARTWESLVRLDPQLLECVVYLYPDAPKAESREGFGGTGFLVSISTVVGQRTFIVTNRHVVEDGHTTVSFNTRDGALSILETDERKWRYHEDDNWDVAVHLIDHQPNYKLLSVPTEMLLEEADIDRMEMRLGDELALIGRHITLDGVQQNTPTARFGQIAQMPGDPITDDRGRSAPCFLAQIHSLPGFSGSPVFLIQNVVEKNLEKSQLFVGATAPAKLLGVNCGHVAVGAPVYSGGAAMKDIVASANTGVTRVQPAWVVNDVIASAVAALPRAPSPILTGGFSFTH